MVSLALLLAAPVGAQGSTRTSAPKDTLESVVVRAVRAGAAAASAQSTLDRRTIERTYAGQDTPLALLGLPSVTASSDAGAFSGYSSIRLRGIDQTRLAISLDGVPLNDPEDQVLYFSNVPDFMNSMQSVRVQRGVGSSAFGTSPFAGSLAFESLPLAATPRFAEAQLTAGSWGTRRVSVEGATGLRGPMAAYLRISGHETEGFRRHSGNLARSAFTSVGWFGANDALKFTGFAGRSKTQLAYYAASAAEVEADARTNPMSTAERDDFTQSLASLQYTHVLAEGTTLTATAYRNAAGGDYDVVVGSELRNFNLDHVWLGLLATISMQRERLSFAAGAHVSAYHRDHFLYVRPDLQSRVYDNTGFKDEQSVFAKTTLSRGAVDWTVDVQLRRALFRYRPTAGSGIGEPEMDWIFLNPKIGAALRVSPAITAFVSLGRSGREPTRSDLFAGADDVDGANAAEVLPLGQVRPEWLTDLETGVRVQMGRYAFSTNLFAMSFRDEIAAIGALSISGNPLRRNVDRSVRLGVEFEGELRATERILLTGNATLMRARIAEYEDEVSGTTYRDVPPLLSPSFIANAEALWRGPRGVELTVTARHVGRSYLANDGNAALALAAATLVDGAAGVAFGRHKLRLQVQNLLDERACASGYTDGVTRFLFPVATRTLLATLTVAF